MNLRATEFRRLLKILQIPDVLANDFSTKSSFVAISSSIKITNSPFASRAPVFRATERSSPSKRTMRTVGETVKSVSKTTGGFEPSSTTIISKSAIEKYCDRKFFNRFA